MPTFFVGWYSGDGERARPIIRALRLRGVDFWEYKDSSRPGIEIAEDVADAIDKSRYAIFLFSDESAHADWLEREMTLANARLKQQQLQNIIPVWIGPHPKNERPKDLSETIGIADLSDGDLKAIDEFAKEMASKEGNPPVTIIPAAVFAMSRNQAEWLFDQWTTEYQRVRRWSHEVRRLCAHMCSPPALFKTLLRRYGDSPKKFRPFRRRQTVTEMLEDVIDRLNSEAKPGQRRIAVEWLYDLSDPDETDFWISAPSLVIADSVSMYHPEVQHDVLQAPKIDFSAVLWVPPFTQSTGRLQRYFERAVKQIAKFDYAFQKPTALPAFFDPSTPHSIDKWLEQLFLGIRNNPPKPSKSKITAMENRHRRRGGRPNISPQQSFYKFRQ